MRRIMMQGLASFFALGVMTTGLSQVHGGQQQSKSKSAKENSATSQANAVAARVDSTYVIGAQDVIDISVWKEPEVSRTVPVRPDGKISLPLLNDVQAAGFTPMQLQETLTQNLKKFMSEPQVTVIVTQVNSRRVYVLGEVSRPGAMDMLPDMTVLQALSSAGGFSQFAKLSGIYVLRTENGHQTTLPFNYKEVVRGRKQEQNITLKPGDTIVVP